jgi:type IV pilus assembly protein PilV
VSQNKGFTLIEVLIAVVILMIGLLGLLHTVTIAVENNIANSLREEAVRIAGQRMNGGLVDTADTFHEGLRNTAFDNLVTDPDTNPGVEPKPQVCPGFAVKRDFRSFATYYCVKATV